jgi:putative methionine-R-sulfoxide reductase with GAF domain
LPENANVTRSAAWKTAGRNTLTVTLPVATAVSTAIAALNSGTTRAYISLAAIAATFGTALLGMMKDRKSARAAAGAQREIEEAIATSESTKVRETRTITQAVTAITVQLGIIAAAADAESRRAAVQVLISRVVDLAQSQCGRFSGVTCVTRSSLYRLSPDRQKLERNNYEGRHGDAPRTEFDANRSAFEKAVVDLATSERVLLVEDLDEKPHMTDRPSGYKSFISVPVRAGNRAYGMLSVDSNVTRSLTEIDSGYMIFLAGALSAGLAQLGDDPWGSLLQNGAKTSRSQIGGSSPMLRQASGESETSSRP